MRFATYASNRMALTGLCLAWLVWSGAVARGGDTAAGDHRPRLAEEGSIKAAYLYNFLFFSHAPALTGRQDVAILLLGGERLAPRFAAVAELPLGAGGGRLIVRAAPAYRPDLDLESCRILYLGADQAGQWPQLRARVSGRPVLTVSDMSGFIEQGGIIGLVREGDRIRWEVNRTAADRAGLFLSAQLLRNATRVLEGESARPTERSP